MNFEIVVSPMGSFYIMPAYFYGICILKLSPLFWWIKQENICDAAYGILIVTYLLKFKRKIGLCRHGHCLRSPGPDYAGYLVEKC